VGDSSSLSRRKEKKDIRARRKRGGETQCASHVSQQERGEGEKSKFEIPE